MLFNNKKWTRILPLRAESSIRIVIPISMRESKHGLEQ